MSGPNLVVFDFDGTLAEQRGSWGLLYRLFGTERTGSERTDAYWDGEITFAEWCSGNVADLRERGVTRSHLARAADAIKLTEGVPETLTRLTEADVPFGVVSSGVSNLMRVVDPYDSAFIVSNTISFDDEGYVADAEATVGPNDKGDILHRLCAERGVDLDAVGYVGDSHSDTEALEIAGTAVLFDPDDRIGPTERDLADAVIDTRDMRKAHRALFETDAAAGE